jgi:hypothetical protein
LQQDQKDLMVGVMSTSRKGFTERSKDEKLRGFCVIA